MTKAIGVLLCLLGLTGCVPNEEYFVEEGFDGVVVVVYGDPSGVEANGVFHIPENGILFVKDLSSDLAHFFVYEKLEGGGHNELVGVNAESGARRYRRFMGIGGMRFSSACDVGPSVPKVSFVVTTSADRGKEWGILQEIQITKATVESLQHRGVAEAVIACYQDTRERVIPSDESFFPENWNPKRDEKERKETAKQKKE